MKTVKQLVVTRALQQLPLRHLLLNLKIVLRKLTTTQSVQLGPTLVIAPIVDTNNSWLPAVRAHVANGRRLLNVTTMCVTVTNHALHGL